MGKIRAKNWIDINELCERLQQNGFSFQVHDFLTLREALPKLITLLKRMPWSGA